MLKFFGYKNCGSSKKAEKFFKEHDIEYFFIDVTEHPPTASALKRYKEEAGVPLKKFFNTSGLEYKKANLKEKLPQLSENEMFDLLASNGRLIKRPIVTNGEKCTVGFNKDTFADMWL